MRALARHVIILALIIAPSARSATPTSEADGFQETKNRTSANVETDGGLSVESADGAFMFSLGGNLWIDGAVYNEDKASLRNGLELRRGRLKLAGHVFHDWSFQTEFDFAGDEVEVKDAYLAYEGFDSLQLELGHFKVPFSLEEQTSGSKITFMERALPVEAFSPSRRLGFGISSSAKRWSASAGVFGGTIGDDEGDSGWSIGTRGAYVPIDSSGRLVHLGASIYYRDTNADEQLRYRTRPETRIANARLVDTDDIIQVTDTLNWGLEAAATFGSLSLQSEYIQVRARRDAALPNLNFDGWYVFADWIMTGEKRRYDDKQGRFKGVNPAKPYGAWEVALRYSQIDLSEAEIRGGEQSNVTLGLNWYPNDNLRFMVNYIMVDANPNDAGERDRPDLLQFRAQLDF